jgi:hypothetical protein
VIAAVRSRSISKRCRILPEGAFGISSTISTKRNQSRLITGLASASEDKIGETQIRNLDGRKWAADHCQTPLSIESLRRPSQAMEIVAIRSLELAAWADEQRDDR